MIRAVLILLGAAAALSATASLAQRARPASTGETQATLLQSFTDWGAYSSTTAAGKVCYAMSQPKNRKTKGKGLDPAYFFVTTKPKLGVRNEVSFILGFNTKKGGEAVAEIDDDDKFGLLTKDKQAWIRNPAEQAKFIEALRAGSKMEVKTASLLGNEVVDTYSLKGFGDALERAVRECR